MGHKHTWREKEQKRSERKKINATILENTLSRHAEDKVPESK